MRADGHVGRDVPDSRIHGLYIHRGVLFRIVAELAEVILHGRITHHRDRRIVDLEVPASCVVEIADLFTIRLYEIRPERVDIRINLFQRIAVCPAVKHGR